MRTDTPHSHTITHAQPTVMLSKLAHCLTGFIKLEYIFFSFYLAVVARLLFI